jgi:hypothetical protein
MYVLPESTAPFAVLYAACSRVARVHAEQDGSLRNGNGEEMDDLRGWEVLDEQPEWVGMLTSGDATCDCCGMPVVNLNGGDSRGSRAQLEAARAEKRQRFALFSRAGRCSMEAAPVRTRPLPSMSTAELAAGSPATSGEHQPSCDDMHLQPMHALDLTRFQPMSDFDFATWRQGLPYSLANAAVIKSDMLERLEDVWTRASSAFAATGANSLQFISFIERRFPYEFNVLAHAAVGIERHRVKESLRESPLSTGPSHLQVCRAVPHALARTQELTRCSSAHRN